MITRDDAIYNLVHAHWSWVEAREEENGTFGATATSTDDIRIEVVRTLRAVGVTPDEVLRAIRRWLVEDEDMPMPMGQFWLVVWENAVSDVLASDE